jgi:tellurite resistance protein
MIPEESVAYALAAWKRFEDSVSDGLLRAVAGAFVLVAAADGELSRDEADRFFEVLQSKADVFAPIDFAELAKTFGDLSEAMLGVPQHAELVKSATEIAAAADGRLQSVEESVMQDVRGALGMGAEHVPRL